MSFEAAFGSHLATGRQVQCTLDELTLYSSKGILSSHSATLLPKTANFRTKVKFRNSLPFPSIRPKDHLL